jgi:hypothetical protein
VGVVPELHSVKMYRKCFGKLDALLISTLKEDKLPVAACGHLSVCGTPEMGGFVKPRASLTLLLR